MGVDVAEERVWDARAPVVGLAAITIPLEVMAWSWRSLSSWSARGAAGGVIVGIADVVDTVGDSGSGSERLRWEAPLKVTRAFSDVQLRLLEEKRASSWEELRGTLNTVELCSKRGIEDPSVALERPAALVVTQPASEAV